MDVTKADVDADVEVVPLSGLSFYSAAVQTEVPSSTITEDADAVTVTTAAGLLSSYYYVLLAVPATTGSSNLQKRRYRFHSIPSFSVRFCFIFPFSYSMSFSHSRFICFFFIHSSSIW